MSVPQSPRVAAASAGPGGKGEWISWATAIAVAGTGLGVGYLYFPPKEWYGDYMTWFIAAVFAWTLSRSFGAVRFLDRETRLASEQVAQLEALKDIDRFLHEARPSAFRQHIASLHNIFLNDSHIEQDHLIEVAHAKLNAENRVVELLAGLLSTLGLVGTIIGLLISAGGLGAVLGSDAEKLREGMKTTITGLGTAFTTTLLGAACGGVILRILTAVVEAHILRYIAHLSELTEVHVLPAMRRTAARLEAAGYYRRLDEPAGAPSPVPTAAAPRAH